MNAKGSASEATGVVSIRKNAVVTIGGQVNTRYYYYNQKFTGGANNLAPRTVPTPGTYAGVANKLSAADFKISDAKVNFKIDVNDYFDAFLRINLQNGARSEGRNGERRLDGAWGNTGISTAQYAWIRWKNVCNSGFGLLIGRNDVVFGAADPAGMIEQGWNHNNIFWNDNFGALTNDLVAGPSVSMLSNPLIWNATQNRINSDHGRTTQFTPYWEGWNKKLKIELSMFQDWEFFDGGRNFDANEREWTSQNYGTGISGRIRVTPMEGLNIYASAINRFTSWGPGAPTGPVNYGPAVARGDRLTNHETGTNIAFDWTPCFFPRLKVFAGWTHTWDSGFINNAKNDVLHGGFLFNFTEQIKFALQGDWMRTKLDGYGKLEGWAIYPAIRYTLPYGVNFELGYRYDYLKDKVSGDKLKSNTVYGQVGFDF